MNQFAGSIPDVYERLMVPMIFRAAATRLAAIVARSAPHDVLETAAGTGVLTRALMQSCPEAHIVATDLSQPMLDVAAAQMPDSALVSRQQADALSLPFEAGSFDVVVCQFGVMFFPDRVRGYREARRVLRPQGSFIFNVWDRIEHNAVTAVIESALSEAVPTSPFAFMSRGPHGYFSTDQIRADLGAAGMAVVSTTEVDGLARSTPGEAAVAFCHGTPLRLEIEDHETLDVAAATVLAEAALVRHFGPGPFEAPIRSIEVIAQARA
ncbi:class I SAM-dependent methyltransferase [Aeromicrobium sp. P5_D10]